MNSKTIDTIKNKKQSHFEPSMKTLSRILKTMINNGPEPKTSLSLDANIQYTRLVKHVVWLEKNGFVESTIDKSRIKVGLTKKGKEFATTLFDD
jgi:predicted transcriptional regulator